MPSCVGGGIRSLDQIQRLLGMGVEKVAINSMATEDPAFVEQAATTFDPRPSWSRSMSGVSRTAGCSSTPRRAAGHRRSAVDHAREMESRGAGELLLTSIDREGTQAGYDLDLVRAVSEAVNIPVVANGGAGSVDHMHDAAAAGASAVAAGSMFVFYGRLRGVLISYPPHAALSTLIA